MARRSTELDPESYWAWVQVGTAAEGLGQKADAIKAYETAVQLDPEAGPAKQALARLTATRQ